MPERVRITGKNQPGGDQNEGIDAQVSSLGALHVVAPGHVCTENSTSANLGNGATFTGEWQDMVDYGVVSIGVISDQNSATDGLVIQWSADGTNAVDSDVFTISANSGKTFTFGPARRYVRVKYTNGTTPTTSLNIETVLRRVYVKPSSHRIQDSIVDEDDAELVKSILSGKNPAGSFINFQATRNGNFKVAVDEYGDTASIDAFSRLRTSHPYTLFDSKQLYDNSPLFWDQVLGGTAASAHSTADARTRLTVAADSGDYAMRQTKMRFNYQPGKSQLVFMTFLATQQTGVTKRVGLFHGDGVNDMVAQNGIFLSVTGSSISWNIAKGGSTTETIAQASWNVDTLDGTSGAANPSGITLDMDTAQIAIIDYEWLGVGRVRVGFVINGIIYYVHKFNHSNIASSTSVYMSTPNLPLRFDIASDGSGGGTLDHICCSVISEGGREDNGVLRYVSTAGTHVDANTENSVYAILGIRLKSTHLDATVKIVNIALQVHTASELLEWKLVLNPTVADTFTYGDIANSCLQYATGATANTVTNGTDIVGGFIESGGPAVGSSGGTSKAIENAILLGSTIAGTADTMVLCVRPIGGTADVDIEGSMTWRELL